MSLFKKAEKKAERLKMYIYGEAGTGKTITSLHFPNPVMIDTEKGTDHYGEVFDFHRMNTCDPKKVMAGIEELLEDPQDFKTIIVDPFNNIYNEIEANYVKRKKAMLGVEEYEIQPKDYKHFKSETQMLVRKLLALDMNIIVTEGLKVEYDQAEFMKPIGTKPDGPKKLPHMFDIVLELYVTKEGNRMARIKKDRTNRLPKDKDFPFTYKILTNAIGIEGLERAPVVITQREALNEMRERTVKAVLNDNELVTAGITSEQLSELSELAAQCDSQILSVKLVEDYSIESMLDLRKDEADLFIKDLKEELKPETK